MLKKSLTAFAISTIVLVLASSALGQPGRRRAKPKQLSGVITEMGMPVKAKTNSSPSKSKRPPNWQGPGMDADSNPMARKARPPGNRPKNLEGDPDQPIVVGSAKAKQVNAAQINAKPTVTPPTVTAKKPDHFLGGSDDGQSIRRKQPRKRPGH